MVMRCDTPTGPIFWLCDANGRPVGRIEAPRGPLPTGPNAATVLLIRERPPAGAGASTRAAA